MMSHQGSPPRSSGSLRIGTRGSELALWQARHVAEQLAALPGAPPTELVVIRTQGDRVTDLPLSQVAGKDFFTREIEHALSSAEIDLAVHSLKDLATSEPPGLALGAVLAREDPRDVLIARQGAAPRALDGGTLDTLPAGARVGTCSLRRRALLARWRPDLELVDLRGNVPTRIRHLDEGALDKSCMDAIVLAAAGVKRLGLAGRISAFLPTARALPAPGQGAIAVQVREADTETRSWVERLDDAATRAATAAERAFLARLEGGCQVPVGALAEIEGTRLTIAGIVCSLDGRKAVEGRLEGEADDAEALGLALAEELLARGAGEILAAIRLRSEGDRRSPLLPLAGRVVAITRAEPPGGPLERRLAHLGARALRWNAVAIAPPADPGPLTEAGMSLDRYDWVVFTSAHAVAALTAVALPAPRGLRVAAVGPETAAAAERAGWRVERMPADFRAAGLVESFRAAGDAPGARVLLPSSALTRPELAHGLSELGAEVTSVEAYRTLPAGLDAAVCRAALAAGEVDAITFTSPSAVAGLEEALGAADFAAALRGRLVVSIGPTTTRALLSHGRAPDAEARPSTLDGLVAALTNALDPQPALAPGA